jgi:hypothetical protein
LDRKDARVHRHERPILVTAPKHSQIGSVPAALGRNILHNAAHFHPCTVQGAIENSLLINTSRLR